MADTDIDIAHLLRFNRGLEQIYQELVDTTEKTATLNWVQQSLLILVCCAPKAFLQSSHHLEDVSAAAMRDVYGAIQQKKYNYTRKMGMRKVEWKEKSIPLEPAVMKAFGAIYKTRQNAPKEIERRLFEDPAPDPNAWHYMRALTRMIQTLQANAPSAQLAACQP